MAMNFAQATALKLILKFEADININDFDINSFGEFIHEFTEDFLIDYSAADLGRIAEFGPGEGSSPEDIPTEVMRLYQVHSAEWLDKYASGLGLLREIACTTLIAWTHYILTGKDQEVGETLKAFEDLAQDLQNFD